MFQFRFDEQYEVGADGEELLIRICNPFLARKNGYTESDHVNLIDNSRIELKTESSYTTVKEFEGTIIKGKFDSKGNPKLVKSTQNIFVEDKSIKHKGVLGGTWQAIAKGCKWYIHLFPYERRLIVLNLLQWHQFILDRIDCIASLNGGRLIDVPNLGYTTTGWKFPIVEIPSHVEHYDVVLRTSEDAKNLFNKLSGEGKVEEFLRDHSCLE